MSKADVPIYYWDSCMFYEVIGNESVPANKKTKVEEILLENEQGNNYIITSVITHLEVLPSKLECKVTSGEEDYLALFDGIHFQDIEMNTNMITRAREIRDHYYVPALADGTGHKMMDLGDSIHLAVASIYGVTEFHTRDNDKRRAKLPLVDLYKFKNEDKLCGKYPLKIVSPESDQGGLDV